MSRFDFSDILSISARGVLERAHHDIDRDGHHQFGLPLPSPSGVLISTRFEWHNTGVKTKPAALRRKAVSVSTLLNQAAARLEEEAEKLHEKAMKLRALANQVNS